MVEFLELAPRNPLHRDRRLFILTLIWTGARVSEVLALTPVSFQLESGVVAIDTPMPAIAATTHRPITRSKSIPQNKNVA